MQWIVLFLVGAVCIVGVGPLVFPDEERARYAITAFLAGAIAIGLAHAVVLRMKAEVEEAVDAEGRRDGDALAKPAVGLPIQLPDVDIREAALSGSDLEMLELSGALLERAALTGATLRRSRLVGADLRHADLRGANLAEADLAEADLRGANLKDATMDRTRLQGAVYDEATVWPVGIPKPEALGAVHARNVVQ